MHIKSGVQRVPINLAPQGERETEASLRFVDYLVRLVSYKSGRNPVSNNKVETNRGRYPASTSEPQHTYTYTNM